MMGGAFRSFLDTGLVTSAIIIKVPVTLGNEVSLFLEEQINKLEEVTPVYLANEFIQTTYKVQ